MIISQLRCDVCDRAVEKGQAGELRMVIHVNGKDYDLGGDGPPRHVDVCSPGCAMVRAWALIERAYGRPLTRDLLRVVGDGAA